MVEMMIGRTGGCGGRTTSPDLFPNTKDERMR